MEYFQYSPAKKQMLVNIKARPNSGRNEFGEVVSVDGQDYLKLYIKAVAEDGKANKMIIDFLAKRWKKPKSDIKIVRGEKNSYKQILITNCTGPFL